MWPNTKAAEKLNIKYPLIQAPMAGGYSTPELIAAVSNAGGLGSLGAGYMSPEEIRDAIKKIKTLIVDNKPFAVNLFIPSSFKVDPKKIIESQAFLKPYREELGISNPTPIEKYLQDFDAQMKVILEEEVPVFSFTFGLLEKRWMKILKRKNMKIIGTATCLKEAQLLEKQGVDIIIAQGLEAGGHRASFLSNDPLLSTIELLPQIIKKISIPVIGAGGFMNADDFYAALRLRADGVQMGTAFLTCHETKIYPEHKQAILNLQKDGTVLTRVYSGRSVRAIRNRFVEEMLIYDEKWPCYPIQAAYMRDIQRVAREKHRADIMPLYCGSYGYLAQEKPAAVFIKELIEKLEQLL